MKEDVGQETSPSEMIVSRGEGEGWRGGSGGRFKG